MLNFTNMFTLFTQLPAVITAIEAIITSDPAKTIENAIEEFVNHITPGKPNSPTLTNPPAGT